jgi:serine/threonine-protein kinase
LADQAFTIEQKLNASATTTVYRAHQVPLDRNVLLKVLHKSLMTDGDFVARFRREAKACAALRSENIVQVYDLTEIDGAPAIVMEFVVGKSVKEILEEKGRQSTEFTRKVAIGVLRGLTVAHSKGIVHRDIKPGNILVEDSGAIKVTDFGLATVPRSPTLTLDGMVLGTPAYMSPEQARGEVVDPRTDLFSLGITLFELLTSKRIFDGQSYSDCIKKVLSFSLKSIEHDLSNLPPDLSSFLLKMLSPMKEDRFASAEEALRYLVQDREEIFRARKMPDRRRIAIAVTMLLMIFAVLYLFFSQKNEHQTVALNPDSSQDRQKPVTNPDSPSRPPATRPKRKANSISEHRSAAETPLAVTYELSGAANDSGTIVVKCVPWAMVYVNNVYLGQTPFSHTVQVKSGRANVTFSNPMFVPVTRNITVPKNAEIVVEENFLDHAGYMVIRVFPWGEVYIDDHFRDTTPLGKPLIASVGTRKIRIHNPSYEDLFYDAEIQKGDTVSLSFNLVERKHP